MDHSEFNETETKKLRTIKSIAKWFLVIQSILIILLFLTICYALRTIIEQKAYLVFAFLFFYFTGFWILTLSIIRKPIGSQSTNTAKTKLIIVFVCGIVPTIIVFLPILHSILIK